MNPADNDQGFLLPQLTTAERNGMKPTSPDEDGLLVFDITEKSFYYWKDGAWTKSFGGTSTSQTLSYNAVTRKLSISSGNTVDIAPQTLSWDPATHKIFISNGNSIDISSVVDDITPTPQSLSYDAVTRKLSITGANTVDIAPQTLSWDAATRKIFISNGNSIDITSVAGASIPSVQYHSLDPADFSQLKRSDKKDKLNAVIFEDNTTFITVVKRDEGTNIIAPIHLPHGATIQLIQVFYMDRDNQNISVNVLRKSYAGSNDAITNAWNSTGNSPAIQTAAILPIVSKAVIDNSAYSYRLMIQFDPTTDTNNSSDAAQRIYGVQIRYLK